MRSLKASLVAASLVSACAAEAPSANQDGATYRVYFLGGQSNMDGYGFNNDLPEELSGADSLLRIYAGEDVEDGTEGGGEGLWAPLAPGYGTNFTTDGATNTLSDRFGPEISFGHALANSPGGEGVAIIKFSRGGTALIHGVSGYGSWDPDYSEKNERNLYDQALTAIESAMKAGDVDGDGRADRLIPAGIIWMQGEADAYDNQSASLNYDQNLARLMQLFREALDDDQLPVVIGRIKDSGDTAETRVMTYSNEVRAAQARFVEQDSCAKLVTISDDFDFIDGWHYRSKDYVALGEAFADAVTELDKQC